MKLRARRDPAARTAAIHSRDARVASTLPPAFAMRAKIAATCAGVFALGKNHLRHAGAQRAMVIHLGKSQILKGQIAQPLQRVGTLVAFAHFVQKRFNLRAIHQRPFFTACEKPVLSKGTALVVPIKSKINPA